MKENYYTKAMRKSYVDFENAKQATLATMTSENSDLSIIRSLWKDVIDLSKTAKTVKNWNELALDDNTKTAIVFLGLSCTGKTTAARNLIKELKNYELVCFDEIGFELLNSDLENYVNNPDMHDNDMLYIMGERIKKIAESGKNIIIEGQYVYVNARGVLLKSLRDFGYEKIVLVSTLDIPSELLETLTYKRALVETYANRFSDKDHLDYVMSNLTNINIEDSLGADTVKKIEISKKFKENCENMTQTQYNEFLTSMVTIQEKYNLLLAGADYCIDLFQDS